MSFPMNWTSTSSSSSSSSSSADHWNSSPTPEPPLEGKLLSEALNLGYVAGQVFLLHRPIQCVVIAAIIITAVTCNVLVIHNIWMCQLKMRTVNFLLIKNLCIVDLIGACVVLPVPLLATAKGVWDFGAAMCKANSTVNIALWLQHIIMFAMLKVDRVLASCLPFGKYPIFSVEVVSGVVLASWFVSFFIAGTVTTVFSSSYEPAVVLCIPELPVEFFLTIFSIYCAALLAMVVGYILVIWHLKKKREQIRSTQGVEVADYSGLERSALTSFLITISHFLMYVPTMLVIGLHGWFLHPIAILICDMVVYAEFSIHPIVLLSTSTKMRREILHSIKLFIQDAAGIWRTEFPRCLRHKGQIYAVNHSEARNADSCVESSVGGGVRVPTMTAAGQSNTSQVESSGLEQSRLQNEVEVMLHRTGSPDPDVEKSSGQANSKVLVDDRPDKQVNPGTDPVKPDPVCYQDQQVNPDTNPNSCQDQLVNPISPQAEQVNPRKRNRVNPVNPKSVRAHGRSISREMTLSNVSELCRRHASLPTVTTDADLILDKSCSKRHSINVVATSSSLEEHNMTFLTTNFLSTLLSEGDAQGPML